MHSRNEIEPVEQPHPRQGHLRNTEKAERGGKQIFFEHQLCKHRARVLTYIISFGSHNSVRSVVVSHFSEEETNSGKTSTLSSSRLGFRLIPI